MFAEIDTPVSGTQTLGPWSEMLEDYVTSISSHSNVNTTRNGRVMKLGETALKITNNGGNKISSNKRDVSETDLYLLGMVRKSVF